jgi:hypothetical protein
LTRHTSPQGHEYDLTISAPAPLSFEMRKALWETALQLATEAQRKTRKQPVKKSA